MSKGRRYDGGEPKLNIKKVVATILVLAVIIMVVILFVKKPMTRQTGADTKSAANTYMLVYTGGKWGIINGKGDYVINPTYDEMITIPDMTKPVFIYQENVDLENGTFNSYAMDEKSKKLFTHYDKVEAMQNIDSNGMVFYSTNVLKVQKNGLYGLINFNGKELLPCEYSEITPLEKVTKSFVTVKDGKKGLVDNSGSIIIENGYTDIKPLTNKYEDGYVVKNDNGKFGLINYNTKQVLECKYSEISSVTGSNMYVVKDGQEVQLLSQDGTVLLKDKFKEAISIDNSNIIIKSNGKYGLISSSGETIFETEYQDLSYAFDGNYIAKKNDKYGIINVLKETKIDFKYEHITYLKEEGFIEADKSLAETDLIDTNFEVKTTGIVSEINSKLGFLKVRVGDEYKYYNYRLEEKNVKDVLTTSTLYLSKKGDKYGYIDKNGEVIVDYIYDDATEQNIYGFASVNINGKWGVIDSNGKAIVQPVYDLSQNTIIDFIGKWHLAPDLNANYYTDANE